ncbi:MAG: fluoride efflux transporter CrcB [Deltaproteobacteria bacterium]
MARFLWICLGGAAGTGARYLLGGFAAQLFGVGFPVGTAVINVTGSFLIALLMHVGLTTELMSPTLRLALTTGVMGGYTTFSTFSYETVRALQEGYFGTAGLYVAVSVVGGVVACWLGFAAGRLLVGG